MSAAQNEEKRPLAQPQTLVEHLQPLVDLACQQAGLPALVLRAARRLSGGAINQNFLLELERSGEPDVLVKWVMRRGQSAAIPGTHDRSAEYRLFQHGRALGLRVPAPIALVTPIDGEAELTSFFEWCEGEADPRRLMSRFANRHDLSPLTQQLGESLALLHSEAGSQRAVETLGDLLGPRPDCGVMASLDLLRASFERVCEPRPYLRYAFEQVMAEGHQLSEARRVQGERRAASLCHHDFRLGNLMVSEEPASLSAILDWEFAAWGDALADIGWLTAPCWRFGGERPVAGFGELDDLIAGMRGLDEAWLRRRVDEELPYWQRFAHLRWAIIAAQQGERAVLGEAEALELRITGAMAASIAEPVVLHYLQRQGPQSASCESIGPAEARVSAMTTVSTATSPPIESPSAIASHSLLKADRLLAEAALHLRQQLAPHLSGGQKYGALMAANAIRLARARLHRADSSTTATTVAISTSAAPSFQQDDARQRVEQSLEEDLFIWSFKT